MQSGHRRARSVPGRGDPAPRPATAQPSTYEHEPVDITDIGGGGGHGTWGGRGGLRELGKLPGGTTQGVLRTWMRPRTTDVIAMCALPGGLVHPIHSGTAARHDTAA